MEAAATVGWIVTPWSLTVGKGGGGRSRKGCQSGAAAVLETVGGAASTPFRDRGFHGWQDGSGDG
jgi:hypothetical protein